MRKLIYIVAAVALIGCEKDACTECVQTITVKFYSSTSSVMKVEEDEVRTLVCDESEIERLDGAFYMSEDSFGNLGYYKVTTKTTTCD